MSEPQGISWKEYTDTRLTAMEKAVETASHAMEKRLDGMNEFRDALKDQSSRMATRAELSASQETIERELRQLREFKVSLEAKASQQSVNLALGLAVLSMIIGIVLKLL